MKSLYRRFKTYFSGRSMRTKLIVAFSVPVTAVMILAMLLAHALLWSRIETQVMDTAEAGYKQSYDRLINIVETMSSVSDTIYYNGDLQRILGDKHYLQEKPYDQRYREFLQLDEVFVASERTSDIYRAGIYLDDAIPYTNNNRHFMPLSQLELREDFPRYLDTVRRDKFYFSPPMDVFDSGETEPVRAVTLLRPIHTTSGTGKQLAVQRICVEEADLIGVLSRARSTEDTLVYLIDEDDRLITATDDAHYQRLEERRGLPENEVDDRWRETTVGGVPYFMMRRYVPTVRWTLVSMIPVADVNAQSNYLTVTIVVITFFLLIVLVAISILLASYYTRRLQNLNTRIQHVRAGEMAVQSSAVQTHDEISELFVSFNEMTMELTNLMRAQYRSGKAVKSAELRALQAQINPHFLYNTLDLINWSALDHDAPEISEIAQSLAKFYRISLNKGRQIVTIGEELDHVRAYVSIENYHFDDSIFLSVDVPADIREKSCINIILQPFVENAIMHGIAQDMNRHECNIKISAVQEGTDILMTIRDDGPGMTAAQMQEVFLKNTAGGVHGYGIKNIQARIQLSFGEAYGVSFESGEGQGTTVHIRIPALTPEEAERHLADGE